MQAREKEFLDVCLDELMSNKLLLGKMLQDADSVFSESIEALLILRRSGKNAKTLHQLKECISFFPQALPIDNLSLEEKWQKLLARLDTFYQIRKECVRLGEKEDLSKITLDHLTEAFCSLILRIAKQEKCIPDAQDESAKKSFRRHEKYEDVVRGIMRIWGAHNRYCAYEVRKLHLEHEKNESVFLGKLRQELRGRIQEAIEYALDAKIFRRLRAVQGASQEWDQNFLGTLCKKINASCAFAFPILERYFHSEAMYSFEKNWEIFEGNVQSLREKYGDAKPFETQEFKELLKGGRFDRFAWNRSHRQDTSFALAQVFEISDFQTTDFREKAQQRSFTRRKFKSLSEIEEARIRREIQTSFLGKPSMQIVRPDTRTTER